VDAAACSKLVRHCWEKSKRTRATGYPVAKDHEGTFLKSTLPNTWGEDNNNWLLMRSVRTFIPSSTAGTPRWKIVVFQDISEDSYNMSSVWMQWIVGIEARVLDQQGQGRLLIVHVVVPTALFRVNKLLQVGHKFLSNLGAWLVIFLKIWILIGKNGWKYQVRT